MREYLARHLDRYALAELTKEDFIIPRLSLIGLVPGNTWCLGVRDNVPLIASHVDLY